MSNNCHFNNNDDEIKGEGDILQDISDDLLPHLRDLFKEKWPYASQAYFFIDKIIEWKKKLPNFPVRFLCPYGKWQNSTFVAIIHEWNYKLFFFTLEENSDELFKTLIKTKEINWNQGPFFIDTHEKLIMPMMVNLVQKLNRPIEKYLYSSYWWLPKEEAIRFTITCPPDVKIRPLTPKMARIINSHWPKIHRFPKSELFIQKMIERNGGLAMFSKSDNELRAWFTINEFDALGALQTLDEHKRKGYATLLVKEVSKRRAIQGVDTIACILLENVASKTMFSNVGFVKLHDLRCVQFKNTQSELIEDKR